MKKINVLKTLALTSLLFGCEVVVGSSSSETKPSSPNVELSEVVSTETNISSEKEQNSESTSFENTSSDSDVFSSEDILSSDEFVSSEEKVSSEKINSEESIYSEDTSLKVDTKFTKYGSVAESIYGEWEESNANNAKVSYKVSGTSTYKEIDKELVRTSSKDENVARFDILGLSSGRYDVKVVTSTNEILEMKNVVVANYDRSGYAHFNNSKGVGAYNNDGTPKAAADIIYVTNDNKNTITYNGKKGLVNILGGLGSESVIIRIIGRIETRSFDQDSKTYNRDTALGITDLDNLINKDNGDDSYWNMCNFSSSTGGVTLEGVGDDAEFFQWGMTIKNSKYVEVRNLTFTDYPEDACAIEGSSEDCLDTQYVWLHNNVFNAGKNYVDQTNEQDKPNGDGATDMKQCMHITLSYNTYNKCHKTGLVGGSDSQKSNKITFHHNYYNQCKSRLPLGRQANMHMYNNYYYKISGTVMSIRANAYVLSEYNYFESSSNPIETKSNAVVKSFNNVFKSCSGTNNGIVVSERDKIVSNSNTFNKNFDTDASYFYYDATNKVTEVDYLTSAEQAKSDALIYSGVCKPSPLNVGDINIGGGNTSSEVVSSENVSSEQISSSSKPETSESVVFNAANLTTKEKVTSNIKSGIFTVTATSEKTIKIQESSEFKSFDSSYTKIVNLEGSGSADYRSIKFTLDKSATIYIYAKSNGSERKIKIGGTEEYTFSAITGPTELTRNLSAGTYFVCSSNAGMSIAAIKIVY